MSEVTDHSQFIQGYLSWCFLLGIFIIPITMAIFTTDKLQSMTDWIHGWAMIWGAAIGILLTLVAAVPFEYKSR